MRQEKYTMATSACIFFSGFFTGCWLHYVCCTSKPKPKRSKRENVRSSNELEISNPITINTPVCCNDTELLSTNATESPIPIAHLVENEERFNHRDFA